MLAFRFRIFYGKFEEAFDKTSVIIEIRAHTKLPYKEYDFTLLRHSKYFVYAHLCRAGTDVRVVKEYQLSESCTKKQQKPK